MVDHPGRVVCRADGFRIGRPVPVLAIEDRLEAGRTYLVIPVDRLPCAGVLTAASLAALSHSAAKVTGGKAVVARPSGGGDVAGRGREEPVRVRQGRGWAHGDQGDQGHGGVHGEGGHGRRKGRWRRRRGAVQHAGAEEGLRAAGGRGEGTGVVAEAGHNQGAERAEEARQRRQRRQPRQAVAGQAAGNGQGTQLATVAAGPSHVELNGPSRWSTHQCKAMAPTISDLSGFVPCFHAAQDVDWNWILLRIACVQSRILKLHDQGIKDQTMSPVSGSLICRRSCHSRRQAPLSLRRPKTRTP